MHLNIVRPFMPELAELSADFAQCPQSGLVTTNSPHMRQFHEPQFPAASKSGGQGAYCSSPC